jgi:hypothetical protein
LEEIMNANANTIDTQNIRDLSINGGRGLLKEEGRIGDWSQTYTGGRYYPLDPRPEDINLMDIIMGLGNLCRYNGQVRFFSVAEHSVIVSRMVSDKNAFCGLMHDATEPYLGDMIRPVKRNLRNDNEWFAMDKALWVSAIAPKFGLPAEMPDEVIIADTQICVLEKRVLRVRSDPWDLPYPEPKGEGIKIRALLPPDSHIAFMVRYSDLAGVPYAPLLDEFMHYWSQDNKALWDERVVARGA